MNMNPRASALARTLKAFQAVMLAMAIITLTIPAGAIPVRAQAVQCDPGMHDDGTGNCVPDTDSGTTTPPDQGQDTPPAAPTCTLSADNGSITAGESANLTLASENGVSASIDNGAPSIDANGSVAVSPTETTLYTATVTGADGTDPATCTAQVAVAPADEGGPSVQNFARTFNADVSDDNSCVAVSDGDTKVGDNDAVLTYEHPNWTHALDGDHGAAWIWDTADVADPAVDHTVTFTKEMDVVSATTANLQIASDNEYTVTVNTVPVAACDGSQADNFSAVESCQINLNAGANTIVFTVKNDAVPGETNPHSNPAGLIYKITADNEVACGLPKEEPKNSCVAPTGSVDPISFGTSAENTLQQVLDAAYGSGTIDADNDQTNTQTWDGTNNSVNFTAKNIQKLSGYTHVFGYYTGGNLATFTPVWRDGTVPAPYAAVTLANPGDAAAAFSVPNVTAPGVGFAIKAYSGSTLVGTWATQKSLNTDVGGARDHAVVYNPNDDQYVLGFDDQTGNGVHDIDHDYNDIVVEINVTGCTDAPTCNPDTELLQNGSFESPTVTNGALWDAFATGAPGLAWVATWLNPSGAPATANAELQKQGLSGWNAKVGDGTQWAELDSDYFGPSNPGQGHPAVSLAQTITTIVGKTYTFSFDFSPRPGTVAAENKVEAVAGGVVIGSAGPTAGGANTSWTSQSFSFVATTTSTVVALRDAGTPNDSLGTFVDNASIRCTPTHETPHQATIVASKIVCTDETQLPNYGLGGHGPITATTATDWINGNEAQQIPAHPSCHLEDGWNFEVADQTGGDPGGSFVGAAGAPYAPFGPTVAGTATTVVSTTGVNSFHVREQLKDGYIPFTYDQSHQSNANNVSAEIYCSNDVLNYDNYDFINNPVDGATYYCVAWNVPKPGQCNPDAQTVLLSSDNDAGTLLTNDESGPASLVTFIHSAWVHTIDALWIWKDPTTSPADAANGTTETFTRTFTISGAPLPASLDMAVDNSAVVKVNGNVIPTGSEPEHNYEATSTYAIPASDMHSGLNTITFTVTNLDHATANDPENNPAGLLYKLTVDDNQCGEPTPATEKVHILKYLDNGDTVTQVPDDATGVPEFPMHSSWSDAGFADGQGDYALGENFGGSSVKWGADTSAMATGANYSTYEVTGGDSPVVGPEEKCSEGKYELEGYKVGDTVGDAEAATLSTTAPSLTDLTNDKTIIVVNAPCGEDNGGDTGTLTIVKNTVGGDGTFNFNVDDGESVVDHEQLTTNSENDHSDSAVVELPEGNYNVTENSQSGWNLTNVVCDYESDEAGSAVAGGENVDVEAGENVTCTFTNTANDDGGGDHTSTSNYVVVRLGDLADDVGELITNGFSQWVEYNDDNDTIDSTLGSFVTGPGAAPAGTGSIEFTLAAAPASRKDIATYQYDNKLLSSITDLEFSAYSHSGVAGATESPYLVFDVDFATSTLSGYEGRLVYVPSANGSVPQDVWNTYDTLDGGAGLWTWSHFDSNGGKWADGNTNRYRPWSEILTAFPGVKTLASAGLMGVRVGEPGPDGYIGDIDRFVIGIDDGSNTNTTTYDFEPDAASTPEDVVHHSSSRGGSGGGNPQGEVLGASTCAPLLTDYLKLGWNNNPDQVKLLQQFLNTQLGLSLPVSGFFGPMTFDAVKLFQKNYWEQVLKPWFGVPGSGIPDANTPTGFVYQTTKWEINNLFCPGSEPFPTTLQ